MIEINTVEELVEQEPETIKAIVTSLAWWTAHFPTEELETIVQNLRTNHAAIKDALGELLSGAYVAQLTCPHGSTEALPVALNVNVVTKLLDDVIAGRKRAENDEPEDAKRVRWAERLKDVFGV